VKQKETNVLELKFLIRWEKHLNVFADIYMKIINKMDFKKNLKLLVNFVIVKCLDLYQQDLKNVVCIGFPEEKILILINGELLVNVITTMKNTLLIHLLNANYVASVLAFNLILHVFHAMKIGKIIILYLKLNKKEYK
jgi:hypothetical protein